MSKVTDQISRIFRRGSRLYNAGQGFYGWGAISSHKFADALFLNCCELLTDLTHDVTWQFSGNKKPLEAAFVRFFNVYGKIVLTRLYTDGVVVIGHTSEGEGAMAAHDFHICRPEEYVRSESFGWVSFRSVDPNVEVYAMRSAAYQTAGVSDKQLLFPFLEYLDNVLNASNTVSARMGAMVICAPKSMAGMPAGPVLDEEEKKELEKEIANNYGAMRNQNQVMVLPREMSWQVISLASLDLRTADRVKMAVLAIADRLKIPANQVGIIDANSSKMLANGSEMREGDFNKYQSFERLLDQTFVQLARDCGLAPGAQDMTECVAVGSYYTIYNKPVKPAQQ